MFWLHQRVCWCVRGTRTLCGASCSRRRPLWGGPWPFKRRRSLLSWRTGGGGLKLSGTEISLSPLSLYTFTSVYFRCLWFILMYPRWDETVEDCEDMKREEGEEEHVPPLPPPPSPSLWHHVFIMSVRTSRSRDYLTCRESYYITDVQQDETMKWRQFISRRSKVKVTVTSSRSEKNTFLAVMQQHGPLSKRTLPTPESLSAEWSIECSSRHPLSHLW